MSKFFLIWPLCAPTPPRWCRWGRRWRGTAPPRPEGRSAAEEDPFLFLSLFWDSTLQEKRLAHVIMRRFFLRVSSLLWHWMIQGSCNRETASQDSSYWSWAWLACVRAAATQLAQTLVKRVFVYCCFTHKKKTNAERIKEKQREPWMKKCLAGLLWSRPINENILRTRNVAKSKWGFKTYVHLSAQ